MRNPNPRYDTLVIGAGPAGAAAAIVLGRAGASVALVDRAAFPRDKVCGDALIPDALAALARLDLDGPVRARAQAVPSLRLVAPNGVSGALRGALCCLPRRAFDALLVDAAVAAGATLICRAEAVAAIIDGSGRIEGARLSTAGEIRAGHTVLATGANAGALEAFDVCIRRAPSGIAARCYFRVPESLAGEIDSMLLVFARAMLPGYGWVFPGPGRIYNLGVGVFYDSPRRPAPNLRRLWETFVSTCPPAQRIAEAGQRLSGLAGAPLRTRLGGARFARPGLLVAGEAAGTTYSLSGEGIGKALESGMLAAQAILDERDGRCPAAHERYAAELRGRFARRYATYKAAQDWLAYPTVCNFLANRFRTSRHVRARLEGILAETEDPRRLFSPLGIVRALLR